MRASPFENLVGCAHTVILPILDRVNLAYAPTKGLNDAIRMTYLPTSIHRGKCSPKNQVKTVGLLETFQRFH
jgi:hypothetical protein